MKSKSLILITALAMIIASCGSKASSSKADGSSIISENSVSSLDSSNSSSEAVQTWTVTFDSQGGSDVAAQKVKNGEVITKPSDPKKANFSFQGWYEEAAAVTPFDFSTKITKNWTLYAGWKASSSSNPDDSSIVPALGFYVVLGDNDPIALTAMPNNNNDIEKYGAVSDVVAGQTITFYENGDIIRPYPGSENQIRRNNMNGTWDTGFTVHNDVTNAEITLQIYPNGNRYFWITGFEFEENPDPEGPFGPEGSTRVPWVIVGEGNSSLFPYNWGLYEIMQLRTNPNTTDIGCLLSIPFSVNDVFQIYRSEGNSKYVGFDKLLTDSPAYNCFEGVDNGYGQLTNIRVVTAGKYNVYLTESMNIYITHYSAS